MTKGQHQWTRRDRILLAVLDHCYDFSTAEKTSLFNSICQKTLVTEGLRVGLTSGAVYAQIRAIKSTARGHDFHYVWKLDKAEARGQYVIECRDIERAATMLSITLAADSTIDQANSGPSSRPLPVVARDEWSPDSVQGSMTDPNRATNAAVVMGVDIDQPAFQVVIPTTVTNKHRHIRRESTGTTVVTSLSRTTITVESCSAGSWNSFANFDPKDECARSENDFAGTADRINPLLTLNFDEDGYEAPQRPRLLFRAFTPNHGLAARGFQVTNGANLPPPPVFGSQAFKDMIRRHLNEDTSYQSPLLSCTQNPRRAIERHLLKSSDKCSLAVIDFNLLEKSLKKAYSISTGGDNTGPWPVPVLCDQFGWTDIKKSCTTSDEIEDKEDDQDAEANTASLTQKAGYRGIGEWLIWGSVLSEVVAIFDYSEALGLHRAMGAIREVGYTAGIILSSPMYRAVVGRKLLHAYRKPGFQRGPQSIDFHEFVRALYGDASDLESLVPLSRDLSADIDQELDNVYLHKFITTKERDSKIGTNSLPGSYEDLAVETEAPQQDLRVMMTPMIEADAEADASRSEISATSTIRGDVNAPSLATEVSEFTRQLLQNVTMPLPTPLPDPPAGPEVSKALPTFVSVATQTSPRPIESIIAASRNSIKPPVIQPDTSTTSILHLIDLTTEDGEEVGLSRDNGSGLATVGPQDTHLDARADAKKIDSSRTGSVSRGRNPSMSIQRQLNGRIVKPHEAAKSSIMVKQKANYKSIGDDDEPEIIAEAKVPPSRATTFTYTRTETTTKTRTLTYRSRSLSTSLALH